AQLFALKFNLSPDSIKTLSALLHEIERHKGHLSTGIFSTKYLFDVMRLNDSNEIAYEIANQREYPGWGHMLERNATTLWETWALPETGASRNHPMFGSIDEWFYRSLLGINNNGVAFDKIIIKPQPAGDLKFAKGSYNSVRGLIESNWIKMDNYFNQLVTIPPNTKAEIWVPYTQGDKVWEKQNIPVARYEKGYAVFQTGSGNYSFMAEKP
ncbi:MAG: alpha-L-rhamnosidase, partial [Pedobacter sp.]